jgi:hypothetical protein
VESEPESKPVCGGLVRRLRLRESRLASYVVGLEVFLACLVAAEASIALRATCFRGGCARCAVVLVMLAARAQELEVLHPSRLEKGEGVRSSSSNTRGYWRGLNFVFSFRRRGQKRKNTSRQTPLSSYASTSSQQGDVRLGSLSGTSSQLCPSPSPPLGRCSTVEKCH